MSVQQHEREVKSPPSELLAIEARSIGKTYPGGHTAIADVSLEVQWGSVLAYLGRNGSGKTTTVRLLTTLTPPTAGTAAVAGYDVVTQAAAARAAMGVTMQDAALDELMTGREHLELVGRLWGQRAKESRRRAAELLETFELTEAADRRISRYSGGMRRRLDFATALSNRPRVLFLDEPTTGLDPQSRQAVWAMVKEARDDGTAVFLTTQYLEEAERLADMVAIIDGGRVVASGTVSGLTSRFGRVTVRFRVADEDVPAVKAGAQGYEVQLEDGRVQIHLLGEEAKGDAVLMLLQRLNGMNVPMTDLDISQASLEDVFVQLTGTRTGDGVHDQAGARSAGALGGGRM